MKNLTTFNEKNKLPKQFEGIGVSFFLRRYNEIYTELKENITNMELKIPNSLNDIIKKQTM